MNNLIINGCYGRMGRVLIDMITDMEGAQVVAGIDPFVPPGASLPFPVVARLEDFDGEADAIIDFSNPEGLPALMAEAAGRGIPVVVATTGLSEEIQGLVDEAAEKIPVFQSANMSLGINLLRDLIKKAAAVLGDGYDIEIVEKHHKMKKDAPSGTAFLLADAINEEQEKPYDYVYGRRETSKARDAREMGIHAFRGGTIVGEHEVIFAGPDEVVEITHKAYSRNIFANGAIKAALFLVGKKAGHYSMADVIAG